MTGVHRGDIRFSGNYRNQWQNVPVNYMTFAGAVDMKFLNKDTPNGFFAGGLVFDYDRAGDSKLSWAKLGLNGSYTRGLNLKNFLTFGAQLGLNQRSFKLDDLRFDNQFDGELFNPTLATGENFNSTSLGFVDFSAGVNYHWQARTPYTVREKKGDRNRFDLGIALFHLNAPNVGFYDQEDHKLQQRLSIYTKGVFAIANKLDLVLMGLYQDQNPHQELVLGAAGRIHLKLDDYGNHDYETAVQLGVYYRVSKELNNGFRGDALAPTLEIHYGPWLIGVNYDFTVSSFSTNTINGLRGAPEISVIHIITKPKPPFYKACQIF